MYFEPITGHEEAGEIKQLKNSGGVHDIPPRFLKLNSDAQEIRSGNYYASCLTYVLYPVFTPKFSNRSV